MGISARRYRSDRQDILDKVKTKATKRQIVYNLLESKKNGIRLNWNFCINNC